MISRLGASSAGVSGVCVAWSGTWKLGSELRRSCLCSKHHFPKDPSFQLPLFTSYFHHSLPDHALFPKILTIKTVTLAGMLH